MTNPPKHSPVLLARAGRRLFLLASGLYLLGLSAAAALWFLTAWRPDWLVLLNIFAPYLLLPLLALLPLALLWRSRALLALVLVYGVVGGVLLVPQMMPALPRPDAAPALRVVTFNQLFSNRDIAETIEVLLAQDADVIGLQELSPELAHALAQHRERYPYQVLNPYELPGGLGLVSRYPLEQVEPLHDLRGLRAILTVEGQRVTLINTHPSPPGGLVGLRLPFVSEPLLVGAYTPHRRNAQLARLLDIVDTTPGPLLLLGDFNTADREPIYQEFAARLHDAFDEAGWGPGYTYSNRWRWLPQVRIDYVWSSAHLPPLEAQVSCEASGSDHCLVRADLGWQAAPELSGMQ
jgi:endonuclease/exonuclease/phosphatase (EEP) superfamily protein YafD